MINILVNYFFNLYPPRFEKYGWVVLGLFSALFILYIILAVYIKKSYKKHDGLQRKFLMKIKRWAYWIGLVGLILWFLRFETVPWLSMRLMLWLWIAVMAVWLVYVIRYKAVVMPRRRREIGLAQK